MLNKPNKKKNILARSDTEKKSCPEKLCHSPQPLPYVMVHPLV